MFPPRHYLLMKSGRLCFPWSLLQEHQTISEQSYLICWGYFTWPWQCFICWACFTYLYTLVVAVHRAVEAGEAAQVPRGSRARRFLWRSCVICLTKKKVFLEHQMDLQPPALPVLHRLHVLFSARDRHL